MITQWQLRKYQLVVIIWCYQIFKNRFWILRHLIIPLRKYLGFVFHGLENMFKHLIHVGYSIFFLDCDYQIKMLEHLNTKMLFQFIKEKYLFFYQGLVKETIMFMAVVAYLPDVVTYLPIWKLGIMHNIFCVF